jgi:hypothetical protein
MPSASPLTLTYTADETSTDLTLNPLRQLADGSVEFRAVNPNLPFAGDVVAILGFSPISNKRNSDHVNLQVTWPKTVVDTTTGETIVRSTGLFTGKFVLPNGWTELDRKAIRTLVADLVADALIQYYVDKREPIFG